MNFDDPRFNDSEYEPSVSPGKSFPRGGSEPEPSVGPGRPLGELAPGPAPRPEAPLGGDRDEGKPTSSNRKRYALIAGVAAAALATGVLYVRNKKDTSAVDAKNEAQQAIAKAYSPDEAKINDDGQLLLRQKDGSWQNTNKICVRKRHLWPLPGQDVATPLTASEIFTINAGGAIYTCLKTNAGPKDEPETIVLKVDHRASSQFNLKGCAFGGIDLCDTYSPDTAAEVTSQTSLKQYPYKEAAEEATLVAGTEVRVLERYGTSPEKNWALIDFPSGKGSYTDDDGRTAFRGYVRVDALNRLRANPK